MSPEHSPECVLYPVHWLRHAIAAAGRLVARDPDTAVDQVSAEALIDGLAHLAELEDWATVTLLDLAKHATLMDTEHFKQMCTCGATAGA